MLQGLLALPTPDRLPVIVRVDLQTRTRVSDGAAIVVSRGPIWMGQPLRCQHTRSRRLRYTLKSGRCIARR